MHYVKGHTTFTSDNIYSSYLIKLVVATVCGDNYSFKCHSDRTHNYVYDDFEFNAGISPEKFKKMPWNHASANLFLLFRPQQCKWLHTCIYFM